MCKSEKKTFLVENSRRAGSVTLVWDFLASIGVRVTEVSSLNGLEDFTALCILGTGEATVDDIGPVTYWTHGEQRVPHTEIRFTYL